MAKAGPSSASAEDRAVLAHEEAPELAVAAQADAAVHVPFEGDPDALVGSMPRSWSTSTVACIIRSGPQMKATAFAPSQVARSNTWVTTPTRPSHSGPARSTVSRDLDVRRCAASASELVDVQPIGRRPGAEVEVDRCRCVSRSARHASMSGRSGREADAAGDDDDVATGHLLDRPAAAERAAQAEGVAALELGAGPAVAGPAARMVRSRPSRWKRETEMGGGGEGRQRGHHELAGPPAESSRRSVVRRWSVTVSAVSRVDAVDVDRGEAAERGGGRRRGHRPRSARPGSTGGGGRDRRELRHRRSARRRR